MGSGKSSVGRMLADKLGYMFLDTDAMIESFSDKDIPAIFKEEGEASFRVMERKTLDWLQSNVQNAVIATGGGLPIENDLSKSGIIIYLYADFELIKKRLTSKESAKRPLFSNPSKAKELYEKRHPIYESKADYSINADSSIDKIVANIIDVLKIS